MGRQRGSVVVNILAILMMLEIAAVAGLAAYLLLSGALTGDQVRLMNMVFNGQINDDTLKNSEQWQTHVAEEERKKQDTLSGGSAREKLAKAGIQDEAQELYLARQVTDIGHQQSLIQSMLKELESKRQQLDDREKQFNERVAAQAASGGQQSFKEMIGIIAKLEPTEIKEVLLGWDDSQVVAVLRALPQRVTAGVLGELRTPQEVQRKKMWLAKIGSGEIVAGAGTSK
jgi:flagellar motility protein MotE (MotC chaperone)